MIGLESWFFNFTQFFWSGTTKQLQADIPRPRLEYAIWWTMKCAEASAFVGGCIVHPIYRYYLLRKLTPETTTNNSRKIIRNLCRRIQGRFLIAGLVSGPALSLAYSQYMKMNEQDIREKCFKIRTNTSALILDRYATFFFLIGWYWKRFQGGCDGINIAIGYYAFYKTILEKYTSPLLTDKIKENEQYRTVAEAVNDKDALTRFWYKTPLQENSSKELGNVSNETSAVFK